MPSFRFNNSSINLLNYQRRKRGRFTWQHISNANLICSNGLEQKRENHGLNSKTHKSLSETFSSLDKATFPRCVLARHAIVNCGKSFDCLPVELLFYLTSIHQIRKVKTAETLTKNIRCKKRKQRLIKLRKTLPSRK